MARTYKYHVPDAYRGNGGRRPETKRATCSTDPMLDLTGGSSGGRTARRGRGATRCARRWKNMKPEASR